MLYVGPARHRLADNPEAGAMGRVAARPDVRERPARSSEGVYRWRLPDTDNGLACRATVDAASNSPVGFQTCTSDAQDGFSRPKVGPSLSKRPVSGFSVWRILGDPGQPMQQLLEHWPGGAEGSM